MTAGDSGPALSRRGVLAGAMLLACPAVLRAHEPLRLRLGHGLPETHPVHRAMARFAELTREASGGSVTVQLFPNGQIGQEVNLLTQVQAGKLDLVKASASVVEGVGPLFRVFNLPFLFRDKSHWRGLATSPTGEAILASTASNGLVGLTFYEAGSRSFYGQRPFEHPDDLKGLKVRIQPSPTMSRLMDVFGATGVAMPWDVVYSALKSRLVDAAENNITALIFGRHGEVVSHYSFDEHTMVPDVLFISADRWRTLSGDQRRVLREAAIASYHAMNGLWDAVEVEAQAEIRRMGVTLTWPDKRPFIERAASLETLFAEDGPAMDMIRQIRVG